MQHVFEATKVHMFLFVLTMSLNMTEAYFPLFGRLCGKMAAAPPPRGRVRGILNALNPKVRQQATCFFEVTKVHMFLFVLTLSIKMTEAYFPLF